MTWHSVVAICTFLAGLLAYVTGALPTKYATWVTAIGGVLIAIDRLALSFENASPNTPPVKKG